MSIGTEAASTPAQSSTAKRSRWQTLRELLFFATCVVALIFAVAVCALLVAGSGAERRDFISYWAAGQQLAHHANPYSADAVLGLERSLGFPPESQALIVRNPPFALPLVAPLGLIGFRAGALLWSLLLLASWIASTWLLWSMQPSGEERIDMLGYRISPRFVLSLFAPALACVFFGQTALFALLGFVGFLRLQPARPLLAGVSLWLCAVKPHLFLPFACVMILWILVTRSYFVLLGFGLALGASAALVVPFDPHVWHEYAQMMHNAGLEHEFIPCLSVALRFAVRRGTIWLQYLPVSGACVWAVLYYWKRRKIWDWIQHGSLVVLVSMVLSPYAWLTDQVLAFPALLQAGRRQQISTLLVLALSGSAVEIAILAGVYLHSPFYLWTAPMWLACFLYAMRARRRALHVAGV